VTTIYRSLVRTLLFSVIHRFTRRCFATVFKRHCYVTAYKNENSYAFVRGRLPHNRVRVRVTLRLVVYRQSVHLGAKPLAISTRFFFFAIEPLRSHVRWVPCHHGMARPLVADGENGFQTWRVAVNILNNQSRTADKGWTSSLGVGRGANNSSP
jgi:hypothetical protein